MSAQRNAHEARQLGTVARNDIAGVAAQHYVPGVYWYAYGSSAIALDEAYPPSGHYGAQGLRLLEGGRGRVVSHRSTEGRLARSKKSQGRDAQMRFRIIGTLLALLCLLALAVHVLGTSNSISGVWESMQTEHVTVAQGDTLWAIASEHPVAGLSTQQCVRLIAEQNGVERSLIVPGQVLEVPMA